MTNSTEIVPSRPVGVFGGINPPQSRPRLAVGNEIIRFDENGQYERENTQSLQQLNEVLLARFGRTGPRIDRSPSWRDLVDAGLIRWRAGNSVYGTGVASDDFAGIEPVPVPGGNVEPPATPTGLEGWGAPTSVILRWDPPGYAGHAHAEVFKASVNNLAQAVLVGRTQARVFADAIGTTGTTFFYWVRFVNQLNVVGNFNGASGTQITTGSASGAETLIAQDFLVVNEGVIVNALIGDAEITGAKIANASIDDAKISSLSAGKILAGAIAVGQFIQSANYNQGVSGWKVNSDGSAEFWNITARGDVTADNVSANTTLTAPTITGGTINGSAITGGTITGGTVTGGTFIGNQLQSTDGTKWLNLNGSGGFLFNTPNAKIFNDGSTRFSNSIASGANAPVSVPFARPAIYTGTTRWISEWADVVIDTGVDIDAALAIPGVFSARAYIEQGNINIAANAGDYVFDFQYFANVAFSDAFFVLGAPANQAQDQIPGRLGKARMYAYLRCRLQLVHPTITLVTINAISWEIYRIS